MLIEKVVEILNREDFFEPPCFPKELFFYIQNLMLKDMCMLLLENCLRTLNSEDCSFVVVEWNYGIEMCLWIMNRTTIL